MRWIVATLAIVGLLVTVQPVAAQQPPTWVSTHEYIGPAGCLDYIAVWSDGSETGTVWDCHGQTVRRDVLIYQRSWFQRAPNGCIEMVAEWSRQQFTWIPWECPLGVVYYKPDWHLSPPWNGQSLRREPPGAALTSPARPTVATAPPTQPSAPTVTAPPSPPAAPSTPNRALTPAEQERLMQIDEEIAALRIEEQYWEGESRTVITTTGRIRRPDAFAQAQLQRIRNRIAQLEREKTRILQGQ